MIPDLVVAALQFYRDPRSFAQITQSNTELPAGITELLAAPGKELSEENLSETARALGATEDECREIVPFFIKQVMLSSGGDYYRKLGVRRDADPATIRQHYHYLMRLFHPDRDSEGEGWDDVFAPRINEAYNVLKNPQKRSDYDAELDAAMGFSPDQLRRNSQGQNAYRATPPVSARLESNGLSPRAKLLAVAIALMVVLVFATLVSLQSNRPTLEISAGRQASTSGSQGDAAGAREDLVVDGGRVALQNVPADSEAAAESPVDSAVRRARTDAEIEALIQQRLEQATRAVLGPKTARRAAEAPPQQVAAVKPERRETGQDDGTSAPVETAQSSAQEEQASTGVNAAAGQAAEDAAVAVEHTDSTSKSVPREQPPSSIPAADSIAPPEEPLATAALPAIEDAQLSLLLEDFSRHYEAGDIDAFVALFAERVVTSETRGRAALYRDYKEFFSRRQQRSIRFSEMRWDDGLLARSGEGRVDVSTRSTRDGERSEARLRIDLRVESLEDGIKITGMYYE